MRALASSVYHVGRGIEIDLTEPDLGHPESPGLWEELFAERDRPVPERRLQCVECRELRPDRPEWMYLSERQGVRFATHHNPAIRDHPSRDGDQHKAMRERIARAAERAGFTAEIENGRRADVLIKGAVLVAHEVRLADARLETVRNRARRARAKGVIPSWTTVDPRRNFINHVPWAQTDDFPWKYIAEGGSLQIRGGVRSLRMERCNVRNSAPCPVNGHNWCGRLHGTWVPAYPYQLDDLVRDTAAGACVPVIVPGRRLHRRWWVRTEDRDRYTDCGGALVTEDDLLRDRVREAAGPDGDDTDLPLITETTRWPVLPRPRIRRGVCGSGAGPCGRAPARLYACGWRCDDHRPGLDRLV